ncbi:MAG: phenylalanine--tRNA ligase subunit beta [Planctomycetota bacterium]|nr:phenylalanine--tRNA ligase subunit beta [Planctomycetota bacterium]
MKISMRWLGRYVDLDDKAPQQVLLDLTMSTAEVEGIEEFGAGIDDVVVGHVLTREKHPDADKLSVTTVDVGDGEPRQIVCGAPNVAAGMKVAVVQPGGTLPGGLKIKKSKIRGVESLGMICSERELGLSDAHEGILALPADAPVGARFVDAFPVKDHVLEIDNKSINHRPDLWGHYGIARELAAMYGRPLRPLCTPIDMPASGRTMAVEIHADETCPRYVGLVLEGVAAGRSPDWLRWQLFAVGQRPIDLLVDLTNFVMFDIGQPMHAFDLADLGAGPVGVRNARAGETIRTLDGVDRKLETSDLLITSEDRPVALAGIMGGEGTMVAEGTSTLFLESANFHAATIRRTSTRLGLRTDASARFEKAQDPANAELAVHRFVGLLQELCPGARAAGPLVDPAGWSFAPRSVRLRKARLDLKLGVSLPTERVRQILESLEFGVEDVTDGFDVSVPSFRATKDITAEDDLIEEVGRMFRYDNIGEVPLVSTVTVPPREPELWLCRQLTRLAATEIGAHEIYNYSFVPDELLKAVGAIDAPHVRVTNPVAPEITRMRRHVLPSVLAALRANLRVENEVRLFEDGKGYHPESRDGDGLPGEVRELAIAIARRNGPHPYDELRVGVERMLARVGRPGTLEEINANGPAYVHPGRTVTITRGGRPVGYVGHLHPVAARELDLQGATVAVATIDVRALLGTDADDGRYAPISPFPPQPVDVALLVPSDARIGTVAQFLRDVQPKVVRGVELFEVYVGEGIPEGSKSLNFTVTLGAMDRTLSAKDGEKYLSRVRERCAEVGASLRG